MVSPGATAQSLIGQPSWSQTTLYQGDSGSVSVTLTNNHSYQICTKQVYLQFDWMVQQNLVYPSPDTPCIATGQSHTFTMSFTVQPTVVVGPHTYNIVWVDQGFLLGSVTISSAVINIHDAYEKVYLGQLPTLQQQLNQALNSGYKSPDAQSDVSQAQTAISNAASLAQQGQFQNANSQLTNASTLLSQATAAEQSYLAAQQQRSQSQQALQSQQLQTNTILAIGFVILAAGVVTGIALVRRRSVKQP